MLTQAKKERDTEGNRDRDGTEPPTYNENVDVTNRSPPTPTKGGIAEKPAEKVASSSSSLQTESNASVQGSSRPASIGSQSDLAIASGKISSQGSLSDVVPAPANHSRASSEAAEAIDNIAPDFIPDSTVHSEITTASKINNTTSLNSTDSRARSEAGKDREKAAYVSPVKRLANGIESPGGSPNLDRAQSAQTSSQPSSSGLTNRASTSARGWVRFLGTSTEQKLEKDMAKDQAKDQISLLEARTQELVKMFDLPEDEKLVEEFNCALHKKILLQGHLYIFQEHLCFYSNVFRHRTVRVIPFKSITVVRKAKTALVVPNAIEITANGKKEFFTSFISHEKAYRLIITLWSQNSGYAKLFLGSEPRFLERENNGTDGESELSTADELRRPEVGKGVDENMDVAPDSEFDIDHDVPGSRESTDGSKSETVSEMSDEKEGSQPGPWQDDMKVLCEAEIPCDLDTFFDMFWKDGSFFIQHQNNLGGTGVKLSKWTRHRDFGHARDASWQHPVKAGGAFGPKSTGVQQTQRYRFYPAARALVIETSQVMADIPYGDYFRIDVRWDMREISSGGKDKAAKVHVMVGMAIPFSKSTMFRNKIEANAWDESTEGYQRWIRDAIARLEHNAGKAALQPAVDKIVSDAASIDGSVKSVHHHRGSSDAVDFSQLNIPDEWKDEVRQMLLSSNPSTPTSARANAHLAPGTDGSPQVQRKISQFLSRKPSFTRFQQAMSHAISAVSSASLGDLFHTLFRISVMILALLQTLAFFGIYSPKFAHRAHHLENYEYGHGQCQTSIGADFQFLELRAQHIVEDIDLLEQRLQILKKQAAVLVR